MKYFFINMTAFSVFIKLFLFYKQFISEIHSPSADFTYYRTGQAIDQQG